MSRAKYIIIDAQTPYGVTFPPWVFHADIARMLIGERDPKEVILGAGEFWVGESSVEGHEGETVVHCYGKSVSLGIKSRGEEDALVLKASIVGLR